MSKQIWSKIAMAILAVSSMMGCNVASRANLNSAKPEDLSLNWQECLVTEGSPTDGFDWKQAETCFGHAMPLWNEEEEARFGVHTDTDSIKLAIGSDIYKTKTNGGIFASQEYTLYKNEKPIQRLSGEFTSFSPNRSLQNINEKAAWEFSDGKTATIIHDGVDIRGTYGLDRAYSPYQVGGKLIFIGEKDNKYFVIYDGQKVGDDFDQIMIAYCCEPMLWSVQYGHGKYLFWGFKNNQWYISEITSSSDGGN